MDPVKIPWKLAVPASRRPSLQRKIKFGYYAVAALIAGVTAFTVIELERIQAMVALGERTAELFDTTLEIRRFERNFFLHRQPGDLADNAAFIARAQRQLDDPGNGLAVLAGPERSARLRALLVEYGGRIAVYAAALDDPARTSAAETAVRGVGKEIVAIAGELAESQRAKVRDALAASQRLLLATIFVLAVLVFALGRMISRRIVVPLKELEKRVAAAQAPGKPLLAPSNDGEIVSITDACNHMLRELEIRQRHLVRSEKLASLGTLLSGVAHELNNPLSNISTSCQILLEESGEAEAQRTLLTQIDQQTERARNIVRSLLDFARERGFRRQPVPVAELVEQTLTFIRGEVPTPVEIRRDIPPGLAVAGDPQRLQQALLNVMRNAIDAMAGQGTLTLTAVAHRLEAAQATADGPLAGCDLAGEVVDLAIADDGPGIPVEALPRIFDPFFTTKEVGQGLGLGLFITHEIVEEHDGCIGVSTSDGGTTFHIRLPAASVLAGSDASGDSQ